MRGENEILRWSEWATGRWGDLNIQQGTSIFEVRTDNGQLIADNKPQDRPDGSVGVSALLRHDRKTAGPQTLIPIFFISRVALKLAHTPGVSL